MLPDNINYHVLHVATLAVAGRMAEAAAEVRAYAGRNPRDMTALDLLWPDERLVLACLDTHLALILGGRIFFNGQLRPLESVVDDCLVELRDAGGTLGSAAGRGLRSLVERHPGCEEGRFWLAELMRRAGRIDDAIGLCAAGERIGVMGWPVWLVYGVAMAETGNLDRALACFEEAALINDRLPIYPPANLTKDDGNLLVRWYVDILESLAVAPGAYTRPWRYPEFPDFALRRADKRVANHGLRQGIDDIVQSIGLTSTWWALARNDVTARYRRTLLGPWWTVLGTGIALVGMAAVWSLIFNMTASEFFPYLTSGYAVWMFITSTLTEGCACFTDGTAQAIQKSMDLPRFIHVMRLIARNILLFLHTLMIFVAGTIFFGVNLTPSSLLVIPGLSLLILNLVWVGTLFGVAGTRYRDMAPAIGAVLTVIFFVTPVIWKSEMLGSHAWIADWNPIAQLIAIVRDPLLGFAPPALAWQTAIGLCIVGWPLAILVYARMRDRIVFWL